MSPLLLQVILVTSLFVQLTQAANTCDPAARSRTVIKILAATLGIACALGATLVSFCLYVRRQLKEFPTDQEASIASCHRNLTCSNTPLTIAQQEQFTTDFEADLDSPPSPVMQQSLLQQEMVKNYGCNSAHNDNTFLKPPPSYHV